MKTGNARAPALSPDIVELVQEGLAACVARPGREPRSLGPSAVGAARRRHAGAAAARGIAVAARSSPTCSSATSPRSAAATLEAGQATSQAIGSERPCRRGDVRPGGSGALDQFTIDLTAQAQGRQDRSGPRPRRRDPPDHRHPDAPPPEQPDPRPARRAWARRPWSRASPCASPPATCRRRCASVSRAHARPGSAAGRRRREGRVREPAEVASSTRSRPRPSRSSCSSTRRTR